MHGGKNKKILDANTHDDTQNFKDHYSDETRSIFIGSYGQPIRKHSWKIAFYIVTAARLMEKYPNSHNKGLDYEDCEMAKLAFLIRKKTKTYSYKKNLEIFYGNFAENGKKINWGGSGFLVLKGLNMGQKGTM